MSIWGSYSLTYRVVAVVESNFGSLLLHQIFDILLELLVGQKVSSLLLLGESWAGVWLFRGRIVHGFLLSMLVTGCFLDTEQHLWSLLNHIDLFLTLVVRYNNFVIEIFNWLRCSHSFFLHGLNDLTRISFLFNGPFGTQIIFPLPLLDNLTMPFVIT